MDAEYFLDDSIFQGDEKIYLNRAVVKGTTRVHAHNFVEIAYVSSGSGTHWLGKSEFCCSAGDYFIINYNVPHKFDSSGEMVVYNCIFKPEFIDCSMLGCRDFNDITGSYLLGTFLPFTGIRVSEQKFRAGGETGRLFITMYDEYRSGRMGGIQLLRALVIELLIRTLRQAASREPIRYSKDSGMNHALDYIRSHLRDDVSLEELAMMAFLSPAYFCRQFRKQTGMTVTGFRRKLRINEAKRLLAGTDRTVQEIAENVGYDDTRYFSHVFTGMEGVTPTQYRKSRGKQSG